MLKAIFFDALGTLFYLTNTVGHHYALAGAEVGLTLDPHQLDDALLFSLEENAATALRSPARARTMTKAGGVNWSISSSSRLRLH